MNRQPITSACPNCGDVADRETYDIGSGPELSCATCEWCWGADGQDLKPLRPAEAVLTQWVIYHNPTDYAGRVRCPKHGITDCSPLLNGCSLLANIYVAREWLIELTGPRISEVTPYVDSFLENCRRFVQTVAPGSVCLTRSEADDPTIVETWT